MQTKTVITVIVSVSTTAIIGAGAIGIYSSIGRYNDAIHTRTEVADSLKKASKTCQESGASLMIASQGENLTAQCIKLIQATSTRQ